MIGAVLVNRSTIDGRVCVVHRPRIGTRHTEMRTQFVDNGVMMGDVTIMRDNDDDDDDDDRTKQFNFFFYI